MKKINRFTSGLVTIMVFAFFMTTTSSYSQTQTKATSSTTCYTMKEGKMMCLKDGKMGAMNKDVTLKNGTKCMKNGECVMKDGKKMKMKEGDCIDMSGTMCAAKGNGKGKGNCCNNESKGKYSCPMHKEVTSDKPGQCPKCKMDLEK
ncbi:DUF6799 domain-containing protein [Flavobacterium sp. RSB2_4_14]|uniref:DUF6799 domain-containing protein n=1 Tax=Flavobacterium sp. RSB2_4_14 TaxID=3447665 RepID=UPI003F2D5FC1